LGVAILAFAGSAYAASGVGAKGSIQGITGNGTKGITVRNEGITGTGTKGITGTGTKASTGYGTKGITVPARNNITIIKSLNATGAFNAGARFFCVQMFSII